MCARNKLFLFSIKLSHRVCYKVCLGQLPVRPSLWGTASVTLKLRVSLASEFHNFKNQFIP